MRFFQKRKRVVIQPQSTPKDSSGGTPLPIAKRKRVVIQPQSTPKEGTPLPIATSTPKSILKTSGNVSSQGEEEPPEKLLVVSPVPESSYSYTRKAEEFKKMFGKNLKDMKRTKVPAKRKFSEWFPEKKEKMVWGIGK